MKTQDSHSTGFVVGAACHASRVAWLNVVYIVAGCLAMSFAAQVRLPVPGTDVPMTLQLLGVFLIGFALRPTSAVAAMVLYVVCGASGLPVFAGPTGLAGGTAGYILGYIPAVWLVSVLGHRSAASVERLLAAGFCGMAVVFAMGVAWRVMFFRSLGSGDAAWGMAIASGVSPFMVKAFVELALAAACAKSVGRLVAGRRGDARPGYGSDQV